MSYLKVEKLDLSAITKIQAQLPGTAKKVAHIVAVQAAKDTEPFVPMRTGLLKNRVRVKGNIIIYPGPYARYLYYGKVMVNAATGKGPMHFVDKQGNEVISWPKGAVLKPSNRDLNIRKTYHPDAQAHWFEASKKKNLETWKETAARAIEHELNK